MKSLTLLSIHYGYGIRGKVGRLVVLIDGTQRVKINDEYIDYKNVYIGDPQ